jgi:hypothetical protein
MQLAVEAVADSLMWPACASPFFRKPSTRMTFAPASVSTHVGPGGDEKTQHKIESGFSVHFGPRGNWIRTSKEYLPWPITE